MYVCMYVCLYECMCSTCAYELDICVCMYAYMRFINGYKLAPLRPLCVSLCMQVCMYVCMHICLLLTAMSQCKYVYMRMQVRIYAFYQWLQARVFECNVCVCACMYVCIYAFY